jgi:hypothetical protein
MQKEKNMIKYKEKSEWTVRKHESKVEIKLATNCMSEPEMKGKFFFQHENARSHISILKRETTAEFRCTVKPYSPDLAPSDFHLFGPMKDGLHTKNNSPMMVLSL